MKLSALLPVSLLVLSLNACSDSSDSNDNQNETAQQLPSGGDATSGTPTTPGTDTPATGETGTGTETPTPGTDGPAVVNPVHEVLKFEVDATNKEAWAHFDLDSGKIVAETDASWDLAFKRTSVKMNADVKALVLKDQLFDAITTAPAGDYAADAPVAGGLETDGLLFHTPSAWYSYDMEVHVISSRNYVYIVKANGGQTVKVAIDDYYNVDRLPAFIQLKTQIIAAE